MKLEGYANLTEMARKAPITAATTQQFRNAALQTVDQAIDVFFKPEREIPEGKAAYDNLTDLECSLRAYAARLQSETAATNRQFDAKVKQMMPKDKKEEHVSGPSLLPGGKPLTDGTRYQQFYNRNHGLGNVENEVLHAKQLAEDLGSMIPLYASVALVPGPLSVSLREHLKETIRYSFGQPSKKEQRGPEKNDDPKAQAFARLVQERVMPSLHHVHTNLADLSFSKGQVQEYVIAERVSEYEPHQETQGKYWRKKQVTVLKEVNEGLIEHKGTLPVVPEHMSFFSVTTNQGLEKPGAGAELVDFVEQAELTPEFVDKFRNKARSVLDEAVNTLFDPKREVSDGRKAYDRLNNLARAMKLADSRWGAPQNGLKPQVQSIQRVAPLYASAAMVPGEMSSSVKNHARELFGAYTEASQDARPEKQDAQETPAGNDPPERRRESSVDSRIMPILHKVQVDLERLEKVGDQLVLPYLRC